MYMNVCASVLYVCISEKEREKVYICMCICTNKLNLTSEEDNIVAKTLR